MGGTRRASLITLRGFIRILGELTGAEHGSIRHLKFALSRVVTGFEMRRYPVLVLRRLLAVLVPDLLYIAIFQVLTGT